MDLIQDEYGRTFKTLRVSLLTRCNLGCVYCTEGNDSLHLHEKTMPVNQLLQIISRLHDTLQLETIRLTDGEPLLYKHLIPVIAGIRGMEIEDIKLTTNGFLLERMALPMKQAGMKSINVSLDSVDEDVFFLVSKRNNVQRVIDGIDAAIGAGFSVKLNAVLMKGVNESQLLPLLEFAFERKIVIRFLEVMAMGHLFHSAKKYLFPRDEILSTIASKYSFDEMPRHPSSTSHYWRTEGGNMFGIIANESEPFCHDCNRLRLDSNGNIYGCLSSNHPISLVDVEDHLEIREKLHEALRQKQPFKFVGSELSMLDIGG